MKMKEEYGRRALDHENAFMHKQIVDLIIAGANDFWRVNLTEDCVVCGAPKTGEDVEEDVLMTYTEANEAIMRLTAVDDRLRVQKQFERDSLLRLFHVGNHELRVRYYCKKSGVRHLVLVERTAYLFQNEVGEVCALITLHECGMSAGFSADNYEEQKDQLTGVLKREFFEKNVRNEFSESSGGVLFMIDVDNFKDINDQYGHMYGDTVLRMIASAIRNNFRKDDFVGRFGGDEFVVEMYGVHDDGVIETCMARLLKSIRELKLVNGDRVSISVGIEKRKRDESLEALYQRTDQALYTAKRAGKAGYHISERNDQIEKEQRGA